MTPTSVVLVTALIAGPAEPSDIPVHSYCSRGWSIQQTTNFRICSREMGANHSGLARRCERLREQLEQFWFGRASEASWTPRCDVIVHSTLQDYQRTLGAGAGQSVGCTTISMEGERVVKRRIDIRLDADNWSLDALPHELTHVVMADRFAGRRLPHWANEGMGVLAESPSKQEKRRAAFRHVAATGSAFDTRSLLRVSDAQRPHSLDAFYHQSATLVALLVERQGPVRFTKFLDTALDSGYEQALRQEYTIGGTAHLSQLWRNSEYESSQAAPTSLIGMVAQ